MLGWGGVRPNSMSSARAEIIVKQGDLSLGRFILEPGEYVIGRDSSCDINLDLDEISSTHARLVLTEDYVQIEDLNSDAGTTVSGRFVEKAIQFDLPNQVKLGATILEILPIEEGHPSTVNLSRSQMADDGALEESLRGERYEVGYTISHGSMGAIHGARDLNLGRTVAMKVILEGKLANRQNLFRFVREAQVMGQLDHPNIAPVYELSVDDRNRVYYTMKYVRGFTLKEVLNRIQTGDRKMIAGYPLAKLLSVFQKVCDAMSFAHSKGVIHRDLKPENIMLGEFGEAFVMDWGLAKLLNEPEAEVADPGLTAKDNVDPHQFSGTVVGDILGTPQYMAPEQAAGKNDELDERTDIFALGGVLYSLLTLKAPIVASSLEELLRKIEMGFVVPPTFYNRSLGSRLAPFLPKWLSVGRHRKSVGKIVRTELVHCPGGAIPEPLSDIGMKAMARDPDNRYQSVAELQEDITEFQAGVEGALKRHKRLIWSMLFLVASLLGFILNEVVSGWK
jgi:serine/threonine protein kinase